MPIEDKKPSQHWATIRLTLEKYIKTLPLYECSVDICYDFLREGLFKQLVAGRKSLYYIGCRDLQTQFLKEFNLNEVFAYHITPEKKFTSADTGIEIYPEAVLRVERWMQKANPQGQLLFVGAGVFGKIFCNWWRDLGGQAFDIGSVMDEWAGCVTRGKDRMLDLVKQSKYTL